MSKLQNKVIGAKRWPRHLLMLIFYVIHVENTRNTIGYLHWETLQNTISFAEKNFGSNYTRSFTVVINLVSILPIPD